MSGHPTHNGYCTRCGKHSNSSGGCETCPRPAIVSGTTIVLPPQTVEELARPNCGHGRPSPQICPWCLGINRRTV